MGESGKKAKFSLSYYLRQNFLTFVKKQNAEKGDLEHFFIIQLYNLSKNKT